ncbi:MAG: macro domain-containing protein [Pseudomonadota bacterium]|nr:macro domain-containing protein [Pseudomonadota bacterium]
MTIKIIQGDLLSQEVDAIVNTVNCVGIMGKGIALQFKQKWPENYKAYEKACKAKELRPGKMLVHDLGALGGKPHYIVNFPTKDHWRGKSQIAFIEEGLKDLVTVIERLNIHSIAIPPLGCGNGGLAWDDVRSLIESYLRPLDNQLAVHLFEPSGAPAASAMVIRTARPEMTAGRAVLIKLLSLYRETGYLLSKIEVQKLGYFAHVAGVMPRLNYGKNQYGPFSYPLNKALERMNGHFITGVGDNDKSEAQISVIADAINEADVFLQSSRETIEKLNHIEELIDGFESPYGMELLATVHWAAVHDANSPTPDEVTRAVYNWEPSKPAWGERKKALMQEAHIRIALERLQSTRWIQ